MKRAVKYRSLASPKSAEELLGMYFLQMRSALLETAAAFDRIGSAQGGTAIQKDKRYRDLLDACRLILEGADSRAERILMLFSEPAGR